MPARYEAMRDSMIAKGVPTKKAKKIAAIKYNKTRKPGEAPMTRNYEATKAKRAKKSRKKKKRKNSSTMYKDREKFMSTLKKSGY